MATREGWFIEIAHEDDREDDWRVRRDEVEAKSPISEPTKEPEPETYYAPSTTWGMF